MSNNQQNDQKNTVYYSTNQDFSTSIENAGYDLRACECDIVQIGERKLIKTDLILQMPNNMFAKIESRSGLAMKGIDARGGIIDAGYRNILGVILHNTSDIPFPINKGDRIAQLLFLPILHPNLIKINQKDLSNSERGTKGYGSSGMK
jgi:dUTP pyrophosphatase